MIVTLSQPVSESYINFSDEVEKRALRDYNFTYNENIANYVTANFHDAVLLLCGGISRTLEANENIFERNVLVNQMRNTIFKGITGNVTIDSEGDRLADYALLHQVDLENGVFEVFLV